MRKIISLNGNWEYKPEERSGVAAEWTGVSLPHTNIELPYNCFDEKDYQFRSTYRRKLEVPAEHKGSLVFLDFEAVMSSAEVFINGVKAGEHHGGYTPFSVELTPHLVFGGENLIEVSVDSTENPNVPPFGNVIDYLTYGGIYREVFLRICSPAYIDCFFAKPEKVLTAEKELDLNITISNNLPAFDAIVTAKLFPADNPDKLINIASAGSHLQSGENAVRLRMKGLDDVLLWDTDSPVLYRVEVSLERDGECMDSYSERTGFRSCEFKPEGFFLNGKALKLIGLNRHQSYPYAGYAMPARVQRRDADIIRYELGANIVRTSHYPQSRHFHDRCDEIGLLVFEEIPGWQHIGGGDWKKTACENVREMIIRDRNRPSVIIWGVRINESQDDHGFYEETNRIARSLDDTRATGGVRYIEKSELLEDVYTMNDFVHSGDPRPLKVLRNPASVTGRRSGRKCSVPYLVTEHNGHMFPVKRFDQEARIREHCLRHLRVINRASADPGICGAIGWCAFDYNTHREFGSGDKICYHGVSDMFRIPKPAAAVYSSQMSPDFKVVMEPASLFAKGERSAARVLPIEVYTNCDSIILYRNGREIGEYFPASAEYPGINHPPVIISDLVGKQLDSSRFKPRDRETLKSLISFVMINGEEALKPRHYLKLGLIMKRYGMKFPEMVDLFMKFNAGWGDTDDFFELAGIVNGKERIRRTFGTGSLADLEISADDKTLSAGDWDSTRIVFRLLDQYGNVLPFASEFIRIHIDGPATVIGPEIKAMTGGVAAYWIKTEGRPGNLKISGECSRMTSGTVEIEILQE